MTVEEIGDGLNDLALQVRESLGAGAVVIMALIRDENGEMVLPVGSTGGPNAMRFLADRLPGIADSMRRASHCDGDTYKEELTLGPDPNAN